LQSLVAYVVTRRARTTRRCCRASQRDAILLPQVQRVYDQNLRVYGADKVCGSSGVRHGRGTLHRRAADAVARVCKGVRRGQAVRTTVA